MVEVKVKIDGGAKCPVKAHTADAGFDIFSPDDFTVAPMIVNQAGMAIIDTKMCMQIPDGYCGLIVSKSGLNVKHNLTGTGLIDAGYTGHIVVKLYNHGDTEYKINAGDKIAQIIILPVPDVRLEVVDSLDETERNDNGFGSTGR